MTLQKLAGTPAEGSNKRKRTETRRDGGNQETGLMRDGGLPRFVGSASGIHFVRKVYSILGRSGNQPSETSARPQLQLVPGEDDQLHHTATSVGQTPDTPGSQACKPFWSDEEVLSAGNADFPPITFEWLAHWTMSYFETWHQAFPFLRAPEVLVMFETVAEKGIQNVPETDAIIVRSIISIAIADTRQGDRRPSLSSVPVPAALVFLNLDHVASCASFVLRTPASLRNMQAALCVQLFLVSMLKLNMASRLGGSIVRMAYHLGLHRCPCRYPNFSPQEVAMRKRIWWSFYCLERLVCQALGLPLDVQDDDVDVCFPTVEYHQKAVAGSVDENNPTTGSNHQLQLLTLLSKHARLRGMILELRHKSLHVRQDSIERALHVQAELTGWSNHVHDLLVIAEANAGQKPQSPRGYVGESISPVYKTLLLVLQHELTIALNRPLLTQKPRTPASEAALQACIQASRAIIEAVDGQEGLPQSLAAGHPTMSMLLAVWPLLTWSVWMSCFVLTYAGLEGVTSVASALRYAKTALHILRALSKRGTSWPESCAQAVEYLIVALEERKSSPADTHPGSGHSSEATPSDGPNSHSAMSTQSPSNPGVHATPNHGVADADAVSENTLAPRDDDFMTGLDDEYWQFDPLFDPLSALDFSNFAQAGSADSAIGLTF